MEKNNKIAIELTEEEAGWLLVFLERAFVDARLDFRASRMFMQHWESVAQKVRNAIQEQKSPEESHGGIRRDPGRWE